MIINNDKRIANPANVFFSKPIIKGDTIEAGGIYSQSTNPFSRYIEILLQNRDNIENFGYLMVPLNVKYILLTKEADYQGYMFLKEQDDLELVIETENLYLFKNINEVSRVYGLDEIPDFLVSPSFDLDSYKKAEFIPIQYEKNNPAKYTITENPKNKYVAFTVPQSKNWFYGKSQPINDEGVINIYESDGPLSLENKNSRIYLILYGFSFAVFILLIFLYFKTK